LGWYEDDAFADGTPIKFNEPYFTPDADVLADMFGPDKELGLHAKIVGETSNWEVIPVVVRIGKEDIQAGAGDTLENTTLASVEGVNELTQGSVKVSWQGDPTWKENFYIKVDAHSDGTFEVYLNGGTEPVDVLSAFGLTVELTSTPTEDEIAYFKFQYAVEPATVDDVATALDKVFDELTGLEFDYLYVIG